MKKLILILGDQLSHNLSSLAQANKKNDIVMLCEVMAEATYVPHHKKKIAFLFSAMRHFADELSQKGYRVHYVTLNDNKNTGNFTSEVTRAIEMYKPHALHVTEAGEWRVQQMMKDWQENFDIPVTLHTDNRFLATHEDFAAWAKGKKQLRMEFFYREMRKKYNILINKKGEPEGGAWNYDKENRAAPPSKGLKIPKRLSHKKSQHIKDVLHLVSQKFAQNFGTLEPFHYAVTSAQAEKELNHFITHLLPHFGTYQDAMLTGEPYLYHSLLSSYINAGLLLPIDVCRAAERAYHAGTAPLNAVEGFIRQILGWREYIRGIYWHFMPEYGERNTLNAVEPLPAFYWTAQTKMNCVKEAVEHTRDHAYSHHIQRLMITGNFALLAGLDVKQVQEWYLSVYSDAYEWVEMPNTLGMALYGDGGIVASKPYAASGKYIHKMSNYCQTCVYNPEKTTEADACPFNALYWDFMARHQKTFQSNQRMGYVISTWKRFDAAKQSAILKKAAQVKDDMRQNKL